MAPTPTPDNLVKGDLAARFGSAYGVGLILSNKELLALAYRAQGYENAHVDEQTGSLVIGKHTKDVEWDANRITLEIQQTNWYQNHDGQQRQAENARLSDPGSWDTIVKNVSGSLRQQAVSMGANPDAIDFDATAKAILEDNWDFIGHTPDAKIPDSILNSYLVPHIYAKSDGSFGGAAGTNAAALRKMTDQYGVNMSDQWYLHAVRGLQDGTLTQADLTNELVNTAKSAWTGLGDRINATTPTTALASSYIQTMANTLEIDPEMIDLRTPEIKKALSFVDPSSGQVRPRTLWEFEQDLRKDPRWDNTKQGQKELSDASMSMLKDFGFVK